MACLNEVPDIVFILIRVRIVGVVPVHPVAEANGLLGLDAGEPWHPFLARRHEAGDAELFDVTLGGEAHRALHLHLDPEPLAVEAVLVALAEALHGFEALVQVLVGAPPGVVHAHGVVGGDGPIDEGPPPWGGFVAVQVLLYDALLLPPALRLTLLGYEVDLSWDGFEHDTVLHQKGPPHEGTGLDPRYHPTCPPDHPSAAGGGPLLRGTPGACGAEPGTETLEPGLHHVFLVLGSW